jgi:hypothetical protein
MAFPDIEDVLAQYAEAKNKRSGVEQQWRMNAAYCLPREYSEWSTDGAPITYQRLMQTTRFAYDGTGAKSVPRYGSVINRLLTPEGQRYHILEAEDDELQKIRAVRIYFYDLNSLLFKRRHASRAMFKQAQGEMYTHLGVYGNGAKSITWSDASPTDPVGGLVYKEWPVRDIFILVDDEGRMCGTIRRMFLTARHFSKKFPGVAAPKSIADADQPGSKDSKYVEFIHFVAYRSDYVKGALDVRRHPWIGCYVCVPDKVYVGGEQGFLINPYRTPRTATSSGSPYGYSPAEYAFPALGSANAMKKTLIKQGHKAVDPTLLVNDDGVLSGRIDTRPNALVYGGLNSQGQKMVQALDTGGNFQVGQDLLEDERNDIADNFLSTVFRMLEENKDMTAAAVYEAVAKEAALVAPIMGRLQAEDIDPMVEREIALLAEHGQLPEPPPELIEAGSKYKVTNTSPMAKAMFAEEVSGFFRLGEQAIAAAGATGDAGPLDHFDYDTAYPEIADRMSIPARWMASAEVIAQKRQARQQRFEMEQMVKAAPAAASVVASETKTQQGKNAG